MDCETDEPFDFSAIQEFFSKFAELCELLRSAAPAHAPGSVARHQLAERMAPIIEALTEEARVVKLKSILDAAINELARCPSLRHALDYGRELQHALCHDIDAIALAAHRVSPTIENAPIAATIDLMSTNDPAARLNALRIQFWKPVTFDELKTMMIDVLKGASTRRQTRAQDTWAAEARSYYRPIIGGYSRDEWMYRTKLAAEKKRQQWEGNPADLDQQFDTAVFELIEEGKVRRIPPSEVTKVRRHTTGKYEMIEVFLATAPTSVASQERLDMLGDLASPPSWLGAIARRVDELMQDQSFVDHFRENLSQWCSGLTQEFVEQDERAKRREQYENEHAVFGPFADGLEPAPTWQRHTRTELIRDAHGNVVGKRRVEFYLTSNYPIEMRSIALRSSSLFPLPVRALRTDEKYAALAAIHDAFCEGVPAMPWPVCLAPDEDEDLLPEAIMWAGMHVAPLGMTADWRNRMTERLPEGFRAFATKSANNIGEVDRPQIEAILSQVENENHRDKSKLVTRHSNEPSKLTVSDAARLLQKDFPHLTLERARARVSRAAGRNKFVCDGKYLRRRIDPNSFAVWRIKQREDDLDAEE